MAASLSPARGWRGRAVVAAAVAVCSLAPAAGAAAVQQGNSAPASDEPPQQRAVLDLVVNQEKAGQVLAVIRRGDVLVPPEALRRAGLGEVQGRREIVGTRGFVSLASLAPGVRYRLDEKGLVLRVTASPDSFGTKRLDLRSREHPAFSVSRTTSAFFNYGLDWRQAGTRGATAELGINIRGVLLTSSGTWQRGGRFMPGLTSLVIDDRRHLLRVVLGESVAGDPLLGGAVLLAGAKVARDYSVDPYFVQYPLLGMSGLVETPSTVEVYVDGRLVRQERVPTGRFELANIPVPIGSSRTQVLIRDAFGREQELRAPYYLTNKVLAKGLHEYEYAVGAPRVLTAGGRIAYESPVLLARHRYGFTNAVTAGVRLEGREDLASGGPSLNLRTPFGEFELAGAISGGRAGTGGSAAVGYGWTGSPLSVGVSGRASTERYRTVSYGSSLAQPRFEANGYAGVRIGARASLTAQHARGETFQGWTRARTSIFGSARVGRRSHLVLTVGRTGTNGALAYDASAGFTVALGARDVASVTGGVAGGSPLGSLEVTRSMPWGTGYGYRLRAGTASDEAFGSGRFEYQSPYGRYAVSQESRNGLGTSSVSIAGGVVAIGGRLFAARPVQDGYGLLRVPGVKGVRGFVSNQEIGRTNGNGDMLIPDLLPYYANRVSIADQDVPIGHEVESREQPVAPPYRGGAVVTFEAAKVSAVTGTVTVIAAGREIVPEYGDLVIQAAGVSQTSPIGRGGRFYFEKLAAGRYTAAVQYHGGSCDIAIVVRDSSTPVVNAGAHSCRIEERQP
ncbi:MAG: fimD, outer rane usher protein [Acidobacteria bacterium]|nr:fimD, outer rane usher protein [Acidobacteriota bacterium]